MENVHTALQGHTATVGSAHGSRLVEGFDLEVF